MLIFLGSSKKRFESQTPCCISAAQLQSTTELGGAKIKAGDKVVLWYPSANADETMFEDPMRFDLTRSPNQHLAFGIGTHFCLGARLARLQMRVMLKELLTRCPDIEVSGPARRIHSNFLHGALVLPVRVNPV